MKAVSYQRFGDLDVLEVGELPDPKVGPGEVLVEVRRAAVNPVDWKILGGGLESLMEVTFPVVPGWDVAGVVRAVGPDTPEFSAGDEVVAYARKDWVHGGTFAELVTVPVRALARKPPGLGWDEAAGLPLAGLTAARTLDALAVGTGDTVLVHAASGGVGQFTVQLAQHRGAVVIGTASPKNHDRLRELGATPVAHGDGLVERVRQIAPDGVDAVADLHGGVLQDTLALLRPGGRHASITDAAVLEHGGSLVWVRPDGSALQELTDLAAEGTLQVEIAGRYPLEQVADAFAASRSGVRGKLVITVS